MLSRPTEHPMPWIDSRAVSLRNPDYVLNSTIHEQRPFFFPLRNRIVVHHTANPTPVTHRDIEVHWRNIGWKNSGYHEMIYRDGTVDVCYIPGGETNGASGHNCDTYHIAYVGLGNPTD